MVSARTQATLLLTARIAPSSTAEHQPLDLREWNILARWLHASSLSPEDLVQGDAASILSDWEEPKLERDRLLKLLDRGHALAASVERWENSGVWIMGRSDPGYPQRLRQRLGESAPPLLFGHGDERLFTIPGVAIIGSRDATLDDLRLADDLGSVVSEAGYNVVSGGARGVDERAAQGAFRVRGTVIAILAESLMNNMTKNLYRDHLANGDLVLTTPFSPETGFSPGNAMGRNRLIYCLSDAAIAVSSTNGSGGTFGGASINLRAKWVPLWVARTNDLSSGNYVLEANGARWLPAIEKLNVQQLINPDTNSPNPASSDSSLGSGSRPVEREMEQLPTLYQVFLQHWRFEGYEPVTPGSIASLLGIHVKQAQEWLDRGVAEGLATKMARPVRYQLFE